MCFLSIVINGILIILHISPVLRVMLRKTISLINEIKGEPIASVWYGQFEKCKNWGALTKPIETIDNFVAIKEDFFGGQAQACSFNHDKEYCECRSRIDRQFFTDVKLKKIFNGRGDVEAMRKEVDKIAEMCIEPWWKFW